jgi:ATP-dependent DNA helicase RecG
MDDEELLRLIRGDESEQVERKEQLKSKKTEVCQAICAFANDLPRTGKPGIVVIGQRDDGKPIGLPITDALLLSLADLRTNGGILPFPHISVRKVDLDGTPVAAVIVEPSLSPPVRYDGRAYIRVGPSRRLATAEEEALLTERRHAANLPYDARPVPSAAIDDLDLTRFRDEILPQLVADDVPRPSYASARRVYAVRPVRWHSAQRPDPERAPGIGDGPGRHARDRGNPAGQHRHGD